MANVGFIGLGNMGLPMAKNLIEADHSLCVFDLNKDACEKLAALGAEVAETVNDCAEGVDLLVSMLPSGKIVEDIYIHKDKLLDSCSQNTLVIDCSTISATNAKAVAAYAKEKGIAMIDAPVSGGVAGAEAGSLSFLCGGEKADIEEAKTVLKVMGANVFHAGESGAGQLAKLCNNMLLAIHMSGTAEALKLGVDNGLDPAVLSEIMLASSGRNWSLELYNPYPGVMENVPASQDYQGGFMVNLMLKDLGLALETAKISGSRTPMGEKAQSLYEELAEQNMGSLDFSAIQRLFDA
jgi:3-hydroxyisobutyrate dehydrogenase